MKFLFFSKRYVIILYMLPTEGPCPLRVLVVRLTKDHCISLAAVHGLRTPPPIAEKALKKSRDFGD